MNNLKVIWCAKSKSYRRILLRFNQQRLWRHRDNWKFNIIPHRDIRWWHWNIITPLLRFTKCNGQIEIGLGNHFIELGW